MQKPNCSWLERSVCNLYLKMMFALALIFVLPELTSAQTTDTTTIAGLRAMSTASTTRNYYVTDPGKQGLWRYDQADNSSRDNAGTILVSSSGLRFKRIYTGPVHITWFGCRGDDSFDNTDTLEYIFANFTQVHIPAGIYRISISRLDNRNETDNIDRGINLRAGTTLTGDGNTVSIIKQTGVINDVNSTYYGALRVAWVNNVTIRDIGIYGENRPMVPTNTLSEAKGLVVYGTASNILVERCRFQWIFGHGVADFASLGPGGNTYRACISSYNAKNAFNLNIPNLTFVDNYGEGNNFSLLESAAGPSLIANNVARNNMICGIAVGGFVDSVGPPNQGKFNIIRNNICTGNGSEGLRISAGTSNSEVYGNVCYKNGMAGILISEKLDEYPGVYTRNNNIYNNFCYSNGIIGSTSPIGIQVSAPYNNIYNNYVVDSSFNGYRQAFGILMSPRVANFNRIYGNQVIRNTHSDYYFQTYSNLFFHSNNLSSSVTVNGSGGFSGITYAWRQTSGPNTASIHTPTSISTRISNLINGTYRFQLSSPTKTDSITIQNFPAGPFHPVAHGGLDQSVTLPNNIVDLNGSGSFDVDGSIVSYFWSQISGPNLATLSSTSTSQIRVANLIQGNYRFRLLVTDNSGLTSADTVFVNVLAGNNAPTSNLPPIAFAGPDKVISLPINSVVLEGIGSFDPDGMISSYQWTQISGPSVAIMGSPLTARTVVSSLVEGVYKFRIEVVDNLGASSADTIQVTVRPASAINMPPVAIAGPDIFVPKAVYTESALLDGSKSYDPDGQIKSYVWFQLSGPNVAGSTSPFMPITDVFGFAKGIYVFSLKVTDNLGASSFDTIVVAVEVPLPGPTPANITPVARAGADLSINLPTNYVTLNGGSSSDSDGNIVGFSWTQISGPGNASLSAPTSAITNANNLVQGAYQFRLQVVDNSGAMAADTVVVTVNPAPEPSPTPAPAPNKIPIAIAGPDQVIVLPSNTVVLNGSASSDPDGSIIGYFWSQLSGPSLAAIATPHDVVTNVSNLVSGIYQFQLKVTDNVGSTAVDTITVTVNSAVTPTPVPPTPTPVPNLFPVAMAGNDQTVTLPSNSVTLNGTASFDPDGSITAYLWSQISGPGMASITSASSATTNANNLVQGIYQFRLTVTDNMGATSSDTIAITVSPIPAPPSPPNRPPVAIAGADQSLILPVNAVVLNGNASFDPDGSITSYSWSQVSGPGTASLATSFGISTSASNLVAGVYMFRLEVRDNQGAAAADTVNVTVTVIPPPVPITPDTLVVNMPVETVELDGSRSYDPVGRITGFSWTFVAGPNTPAINGQTNPVAKVKDLTVGSYIFALTVTNDKGISASKNMKVIVSNANNRLAIKKVNFYPNPVSGNTATLQLEGDYTDRIYVNIFDLNGRIVSRQEFVKSLPSYRQRIDLTGLTNGMYIVQLRSPMQLLGVLRFQKY